MLRAAFLGSTELFMKQMVEFLAQHGYWVLFVSVLGRQACLPVPANLLLLAAGALAGLGKLNLAGIIVFAVAAFLLADTAWYGAGRTWGGRTLEFVCGAAADPCACVGKIAGKFSRHGVRLLLVSKFIIGVDAVAAPMAGISRTGLPRFLVFDAMGAILWSSVYTALGYIFSDQLDHVAEYAAAMGKLAVLAGVAWLGALIILEADSLVSLPAQIQAGADHTGGAQRQTECRRKDPGFGSAGRFEPRSGTPGNSRRSSDRFSPA